MQKVYSLRELVPYIFEVDENNSSFEANYKELVRLNNIVKYNTDYKHMQGIPEENKDNYIRLMKNIIESGDVKKLIKKFNEGKSLKNEEFEKIIGVFFASLGNGKNEVEGKVNRLHSLEERMYELQDRSTYILKEVLTYFCDDAFFLTEDIFNDIANDMEIILDEYDNKVKNLLKKAKAKCNELDELDDEIYSEKIIKGYISSIANKKFRDKYNRILKKEK
ncbi:hypothetical protein [Clostridium baratii]|uniref:hypothetical protein n=1 Tax=Clostridium baratii TaxID=1561 RepID=UPI0030D5580A